MDKKIVNDKKISNQELIDLYKKNQEFINYLEKEIKEIEKLRDSDE